MVKPIHEFEKEQLEKMSYTYDENGHVAKRTTATLETTDIEIGAVEIKDATTDNRVTVDSNGALKVTGGASSVVAEFMSPDDFTATYTSSTTITLSAIKGFTITDSSQIQFITAISSTGSAATYVNGANGISMTVSSNVITIYGVTTPFASGDVYQVGINGQKKAYDSSTQTTKVSINNPSYAHTTDVEHIIDSTNDDTTTVRTIIYADTYPQMSLHLKGSGGVTFTIWASNDDTADDTSDNGWVDISSTVMGVASLVDSEGIYFIDTKMIPERYMIKYVTTDATNASDVWLKKGY